MVYGARSKVSNETIYGGERYNMIIYCDMKEEFVVDDEQPKSTMSDGRLLLDLPDPLKHRVLGYLSLGHLNALTLTSNACFKLVTYQSLPVWEKLCRQMNYPHSDVRTHPSERFLSCVG